MADTTWQVQVALASKLTNDSDLVAALPGGMYDYIPTNTSYPYLRMSEFQLYPWNRLARKKGKRYIWTLDVFSRYRGNQELLNISNLLDALCDEQDMEVQDFSFISMTVYFSHIVTEDDNETRHLIRQYEIYIEE